MCGHFINLRHFDFHFWSKNQSLFHKMKNTLLIAACSIKVVRFLQNVVARDRDWAIVILDCFRPLCCSCSMENVFGRPVDVFAHLNYLRALIQFSDLLFGCKWRTSPAYLRVWLSNAFRWLQPKNTEERESFDRIVVCRRKKISKPLKWKMCVHFLFQLLLKYGFDF